LSTADRSLRNWGRLRWVGLAAMVAALGLCLMPGAATAKKNRVKIMSQNLYLGSDLNPIVAAAKEGEGVSGGAGTAMRLKAFDHFADQVGFTLKDVQTNNFNVRARTLASLIKKNKVDVVALQEAVEFRLQIPSDGGGPSAANPSATLAAVPLIDYLDTLNTALNKGALSKKGCKKFHQKHPGKQCYRGYKLVSFAQEADVEQPGDFDSNAGPNGIPGEGPAFNATTGFPPCADGTPPETNPGGDDTGVEFGDPGPPNPLNTEKDPVTGQPTPWDWNGDSGSNSAFGGSGAHQCGADTQDGQDFYVDPPPAGGFSYASDCPDNNPNGGMSHGADDKSDVTSSCLFHGIDGDARLTDRDAVIIRKGAGVKASNASGGHFVHQLQVPIFGGNSAVQFTRGWDAVNVNVRGKKFHLVNTHLEAASNGTVREDQAAELVAPGGPATVPNTVLIGDLNSDPSLAPMNLPDGDNDSNIAYNRITAGGFLSLTGPAGTSGPGGGYREILNNPAQSALIRRIDHILTNNPSITAARSSVLDKFASGLWGSDHAGVLDVLRVPGGKKKK
jgi:endonuclease/exonuclease/phosphatase family metal-dependent hydrolase